MASQGVCEVTVTPGIMRRRFLRWPGWGLSLTADVCWSQVPQEGIEPPTLALGVPCSIRLSYWGGRVSLYARHAAHRLGSWSWPACEEVVSGRWSVVRKGCPHRENAKGWEPMQDAAPG